MKQYSFYGSGSTQTCDCTMVPFKPECIKYCIEKVLRSATLEEKQLILGLDYPLAYKIFRTYATVRISTFEDLEKYLSINDSEVLQAKFNTITQFQLNYFNKSQSERIHIIDAIKGLGLDSNTSLGAEEDNPIPSY